MEQPLAGRVALVTGGTRGIGRGCALELAAQGALVYVTGRTAREGESDLPGSLDSLRTEAATLGGRSIGLVCDHRDDAAVATLFERIRGEQGRLDILVNNAFLLPEGILPDLPFWQTPLSWWDDMLDVGTRSAYVALHQAAPLLISTGGGLVVNISSAGARDFHLHLAYTVGKCALDRITRDAARQLSPHGVAVVSIWPYFARTERLMRLNEHGDAAWNHDIQGAESPRFTGRAVAALAADDAVLSRSGRAFTSRELALAYGFVDLDGSLPAGPDSAEA